MNANALEAIGTMSVFEYANLHLKSVAARIGFASEQSLRKLFLKHLGVLAQAYRERFGGGAQVR